MLTRYFFILILVGFNCCFSNEIQQLDNIYNYHNCCDNWATSRRFKSCVKYGLETVFSDLWDFTVNLFSTDTLKVAAGFLPVYLVSRKSDEKIHNCFYDRRHHLNLHQPPKFFHTFADLGVGIPMGAIAMAAIFSKDPDLRTTSWMLVFSLPYTWLARTLIKKIKLDCCLRPWNQNFDANKRSYGGFPSGHMIEMAYMTTLFSMRFGARWGWPLGVLSAFVFSEFLVCNRHYLSQLVAGVAAGVMFAVAADKAVENKLNNFSIEPICGQNKTVGLQMNYCF